MWVGITQCILGNVVNVPHNLKWVRKLFLIVLLNNDLLSRRPRKWLLNNLCWMAHHRMRDIVEPSCVPRSSPPWIPSHPTPINQLFDMDYIISEGLGNLLWIERCHVHRRFGNTLHVSVLPHHPLQQVTSLHANDSHDPTGVLTNILKRHNVPVIIVRSPYDILNHQSI